MVCIRDLSEPPFQNLEYGAINVKLPSGFS